MSETQSSPRRVRFGAFEADLRSGELRKDGVKLKFSGQPFQVLVILLERPGEVVTREELQKRLWPDTFVDVERNLNTAINKIREVLSDSAENPRFVETLPRRGYRFIATIELPDSLNAFVPSVDGPVLSVKGWKPYKKWPTFALSILGITVLILVSVVADRWLRLRTPLKEEAVVLEAAPFAAFPGEQSFPAFSPDGSRIAFGWTGETTEAKRGFDLYVKAMGSEALLRLTRRPSDLISSAWAPDGSQIAIHRLAGPDTGIYLVPALGGPERKVLATRLGVQLGRDLQISWSPDGQWIAFSDAASNSALEAQISLLSTVTWQSKRITSSPKCQQENSPSFSHSGRFLAFACFMGNNESGLFRWDLRGGELKRIATFQGFVHGLAWSANDSAIIYCQIDTGTPALRQLSISGSASRRLAFAGSAEFPSISAGGHLAFVTTNPVSDMWRMDLHHPENPPVQLVPSTAWSQAVDFSPDGKRIVFQSGRSGTAGIWISDTEGSGLVQISAPGVVSGSPQWSPDGRKIAYDARPSGEWEIYVADVDERIPRKLVTNLSSCIRPHWSRDGRWIYFRSYDTGKAGIYRCPASGGDATRLSNDSEAFNPVESADATTLYFFSHQSSSILKQIRPPVSGAETVLEGMPALRRSDLWALVPGGIYFVPADEPNNLSYFDIGTRKVKRILKLEKGFGNGLSVSSDGRWVAFSKQGYLNSNIMFVDHLK